MCGILGVYARSGVDAIEPRQFALGLEQLRLRGPDDSGVWDDHHVRLGHRRLAIIDVSTAGHQPMVSADGRFVIVFNGEIYNHLELRSKLSPSLSGRAIAWRSQSDTETLLEAYACWGKDCLRHLRGMFAFVIWDRAERRLFAARDRLGKKPLYYCWNGERLAFASRPGALATLLGEIKPEIDLVALRAYLELGYIPAPMSIFRGMRKLSQAHYLVADADGLRVERYWDYRQIEVDRSLLRRREDDLVDELEQRVREAVRIRLISDVPLGAFLSGGTDSATVVAAMKSLQMTEVKTFTIGFKETEYDESPAAASIARHIGVDHVIETLRVGDLLDLLPAFIEQFDEPLGDSSAFPNLAVARLARRHVTVALSGDGGDELFGGYQYYRAVEPLSRVAAWPWPVKRGLQKLAGRLPGHRAKLIAGALDFDSPVALFHYMRSFGKDFGSLLDESALRSTESALCRYDECAAAFPPDLLAAEQGMRLDLQFVLADDYLQKVDVASMAFSLEARCPLLDHTLVEWALSLPLHYKLRNGQTKYLLKKLLNRSLPPELVYRPKQGFGAPTAQWLRGPLKTWAMDLLNDASIMSRLPLDRTRVLELFRLHASGTRDVHPLLWAVLMLLGFVSHHIDGRGLPELNHRRAA